MRVMGLFSGIGGFERSLASRGMECVGLCEIDDVARAVLHTHFPDVPIKKDVMEIKRLIGIDVVTAGFPCQDLSQAGPRQGISGDRSGLVDEIFRIISASRKKPEWVILENVSYMLKLKKGHAMQHILKQAENLGYKWAYRVLDARCFGLPQRRERVVILLSKSNDPSEVLFPEGNIQSRCDDRVGLVDMKSLYGFYWTEGKRGLGWVKDAVPTIKGGSALGIPSPPAIWRPSTSAFGTPSIQDAERMFGFPANWTSAATKVSSRSGARWKLVGNTICVPMVDWVADQIVSPKGLNANIYALSKQERLPIAAFGSKRHRYGVDVSAWATNQNSPSLSSFLKYEMKPLSLRAASGFYNRALESTAIRFADGFLDSMADYISRQESSALAI